MTRSEPNPTRGIRPFLLLTVVLTLPAYALTGLATAGVILTPEAGFAFVPMATLAPLLAAAILTLRSSGWAGVWQLLRRALDFRRIAGRGWYFVIALTPPCLMLAATILATLAGWTLLPPNVPLIAAPIAFVALFGGALSEELGWMGYAYDRMRSVWGPVTQALVLGGFITLWHAPLYFFLIADPLLLLAQILFPLALRVWVVWIYHRGGESVLGVTVFHTLFNVGYAVLSVNLPLTTSLTLASALALSLAWRRRVGPTSQKVRSP